MKYCTKRSLVHVERANKGGRGQLKIYLLYVKICVGVVAGVIVKGHLDCGGGPNTQNEHFEENGNGPNC